MHPFTLLNLKTSKEANKQRSHNSPSILSLFFFPQSFFFFFFPLYLFNWWAWNHDWIQAPFRITFSTLRNKWRRECERGISTLLLALGIQLSGYFSLIYISLFPSFLLSVSVSVCMWVCISIYLDIYIYLYLYIHKHTYTYHGYL